MAARAALRLTPQATATGAPCDPPHPCARIHLARRFAGRLDHPGLHRRQRVPGAEGGPDVRVRHSSGRDFHGAAVPFQRLQHPGKQPGANPGLVGRSAVSGDFCAAFAAHARAVGGFSVLANRAGVRGRRHAGGALHRAAAPRDGGAVQLALPGRCSRCRGAARGPGPA